MFTDEQRSTRSFSWRSTAIVCLALSGALLTTSCGRSAIVPTQADEEQTQEGDEVAPDLSFAEIESLSRFVTPSYTSSQQAAILNKYAFVDPGHAVPDSLLKTALMFYEANKSNLGNTRYLSVIDFSRTSVQERFYVINMSSGSVWQLHVAHGKGSDANHDSYAEKFSNVSGSNASSLGFYKTAETYSGSHGLSLRLDGLSSTNSNARSRAIVVHGASYVYDSDTKPGRSWGCPAVSMANRTKLINMIKGGSIIYAGTSGRR